jgi:hypothetical protein
MDWLPIAGPVEPAVGDDHSERRSTGVAPWNPRRLTAEMRWTEQGSGIRVKEYLPIVETVARSWLIGAGHPVSVVLRSGDCCGFQSAVPNPPGFIHKGIESVFMERLKVLVG